MPNHVLIVAGETAARASAEIARSLQFTPLVASSEDEPVRQLNQQDFSLITVAGVPASQRLRDAAETKQPAAHVLELPEPNGDDTTLRRLMLRHLDRRSADVQFSSEQRYRFLSAILESFTATLDLKEVLRRILTITREEFRADRAWLLRPVTDETEFAKIIFSVTAPECAAPEPEPGPVPLANSHDLIRRATEASRPVVALEGDADLDPVLAGRFSIRSQMVQILRPAGDEPWAFGLQDCAKLRQW